jgi:hypothetical protein
VLEIAFLIIVTGGIAAYARGRGGNPWLWGSIAVAGYVIVEYVLPRAIGVAPESDAALLFLLGGFAWMGVIALCTRFLLGSGRKKPSGLWTCPNSKYLNQRYAVICEACQHPYGEPAP